MQTSWCATWCVGITLKDTSPMKIKIVWQKLIIVFRGKTNTKVDQHLKLKDLFVRSRKTRAYFFYPLHRNEIRRFHANASRPQRSCSGLLSDGVWKLFEKLTISPARVCRDPLSHLVIISFFIFFFCFGKSLPRAVCNDPQIIFDLN